MSRIIRETGELTPLNDGDLERAMKKYLSDYTLKDIEEGMNEDQDQIAEYGRASYKEYMDDHASDHIDGEPFYYADGILYAVEFESRVEQWPHLLKGKSGKIYYDIIYDDEVSTTVSVLDTADFSQLMSGRS